jgi:hypothetical protein
MLRYAEKMKVLPILAPADIAATATATQYVDLDQAHWATFAVQFGAVTNSTIAVTVECSTAASSNATEQAIAFNSIGAITAATTTGAALAATDDNKTLLIDLDPSAVAALGADFQFARVVVTPATDNTAVLVGAIAYLEPRYPGNSIASAT